MSGASLAGKVIALPETRELELFAMLLERRGARVLRCPLIAIIDAPDPQPVLAWSHLVAAGAAELLILLTGEGLRRILALLAREAPALHAPFVAALGRMTRLTRGPKPARALRELGLQADLAPESPTTAGVIETLRQVPLRGRCVAVQLYGDDPNTLLRDFLRSAGATALCVAPYRYTGSAADAKVHAMLAEIRAGKVAAIAFSSKTQVQRLAELAGTAELAATLAHCEVAAIGPVVRAALTALGITVGAMPERQWFMKPLASELQALFSRTSAAEN